MPEAAKATDYKRVRTRWVICNTGDHDAWDIRARLVACELNQYKTVEFYASTPPLEAKRLSLSQFATERVDAVSKEPPEISFVDIRKAYFNAVPRRKLHLMFPRELGVEKDKCAKLKRCVYGTRDAGQLWEDCYAHKLVEMGFIRGLASPMLFRPPTAPRMNRC